MASTGLQKFNKYFKGKGDLEVYAKGDKGKDVTVYEAVEGTKKVDAIPDGHPITVVVGKEFEKRYFIKYKKGSSQKMGYISDGNTGKPLPSKSKVNSELARITAGDFIGGGKAVKFKYGDADIECMEFSSKQQLIKSMADSMKKVRAVSEGVEDTFNAWFKTLKEIEWDSSVTDEEKNKYGVYFGELIIGLLALAGKESGHIQPCPWKGKVKRFLLPTDPSFSGVDSFLELESGEVVPISSKFGAGAAASFFSNLLIKGIQYRKKLPKCTYTDIVDSALDIGVTVQDLEKKRKSKEILYEYGIRKILGLGSKEVKNTYQVFTDLKTKKQSPEKNAVLAKIANFKSVDQKIVDLLEESTTSFFNRKVASLLMEDKKSMDIMREVLSGKNFWQANLDTSAWDKGRVLFKMVNSGESKLTIIGNKAAMNDIDAKQGMINYRLTF